MDEYFYSYIYRLSVALFRKHTWVSFSFCEYIIPVSQTNTVHMCQGYLLYVRVHEKKYLSVDIKHLCIHVCDFLKTHKQNNVFYTIFDLLI